jgi:hypothetical protein
MKYVTPFTDADMTTVQQMHAPHPSRRARMRAQSLLLSPQRSPLPQMARLEAVDPRRVSAWRERWQAGGLVGLDERPRRGRPAIFTVDEPPQVDAALAASPKEVKPVVAAMAQKTGKRVRTKPSKRFRKKSPRWNRIKKAPAHTPDPYRSTRGQERIARWHARANRGEGALGYCDGAGFGFAPALPYAWQPLGSSMTGPTSRQSRRLHGWGFLTRNNALPPSRIAGSVDTAVMLACLDPLRTQMAQRRDGLLAHAPMHRSKAFLAQMPRGVRQGFMVQSWPAYAPELHRIEMLWRLIKYDWLPCSAYASCSCLCKAVEAILTRFGTDSTITFQAA